MREACYQKIYVLWCKILVIWNEQNRQVHRDRANLWLPEFRCSRKWGLTALGYSISFWSNEEDLKLESVDSCTTYWIYEKLLTCLLWKIDLHGMWIISQLSCFFFFSLSPNCFITMLEVPLGSTSLSLFAAN